MDDTKRARMYKSIDAPLERFRVCLAARTIRCLTRSLAETAFRNLAQPGDTLEQLNAFGWTNVLTWPGKATPTSYPDAVHEEEAGPEQSDDENTIARVRLAIENGLQQCASVQSFYRLVRSALEDT